jgi:hypothetical protein
LRHLKNYHVCLIIIEIATFVIFGYVQIPE